MCLRTCVLASAANVGVVVNHAGCVSIPKLTMWVVRRFDRDLQQDKGEVLVDHLGEIEDTKGNNGQKGTDRLHRRSTLRQPCCCLLVPLALR